MHKGSDFVYPEKMMSMQYRDARSAVFMCVLAVFLLAPSFCFAKREALYQVYDPIVMPELTRSGVVLDDDEEAPIEPNIIETKFLQAAPPRNILERIERLRQGIDVDIPPQYDVYGYEIRRYMAHIGNTRIYSDEAFLIEQMKNVKKAGVILEYWQKHLDDEIDAIELEIKETEPSSSAWTIFRENRKSVRAFIVDARSWVDSNERFLQNVYDNFGDLKLEYPDLHFSLKGARIDFYNLLRVRQVNTREIRKYQAFSMMVY